MNFHCYGNTGRSDTDMDDIVILTRSKNSSWEQEFVTYLIHK